MVTEMHIPHVHDPLSPIPPSKHPFQIWMMGACTLAGLAVFLKAMTNPQPMAEHYDNPGWVMIVWGGTLLSCGIIGLVSPWWKDRVTGLLLERLALQALGAACLVYALMLVVLTITDDLLTPSPPIEISFTASAGIASLWRVHHITRDLKRLARWIQEDRRVSG